jgi:hypothetical protein
MEKLEWFSESRSGSGRLTDAVIRGEGLTPSERRLVALANRTFLRLWSYPNSFNDRTMGSSGGGQEYADLLAVFENHVVLFSDKEISWQNDKPRDLAWARWFRRAVEGGVTQLKGAERWLDQHPDRIFTDRRCTQLLPVPLPLKSNRIVHLVAVVSGAEAASRKYFDDPRGTLMIQPALKGPAHVNSERADFRPFIIGDVNPNGTFIHVFDPIGLKVVMKELDTVADFTAYLLARSKLLRSGQVGLVAGEEHLLAAYMMNGFKNGRPSFISEKIRKKARRKLVMIPEGEYETYISSGLYTEIEALKKQSMLWDNFIELVTEDVLKGTSISILDHEPTFHMSEQSLRVMASERRIDRVSLAQALLGAMEHSLDEGMARFIRRAFILRKTPNKKIGYVFLILPADPAAGTYEEYRTYRSMMLATYCTSVFREQPKLDVVVGEIRTRSEDVLAMPPPEWTPESLAAFENDRSVFELKDARELEVAAIGRRIKNPFKDRARHFKS